MTLAEAWGGECLGSLLFTLLIFQAKTEHFSLDVIFCGPN